MGSCARSWRLKYRVVLWDRLLPLWNRMLSLGVRVGVRVELDSKAPDWCPENSNLSELGAEPPTGAT